MIWVHALYLNLKILLVNVMMVYRVVYNAKVVSLSTKQSHKISQFQFLIQCSFFSYSYQVHKEKLNRNSLVVIVYLESSNQCAKVVLMGNGAAQTNIRRLPCALIANLVFISTCLCRWALPLMLVCRVVLVNINLLRA